MTYTEEELQTRIEEAKQGLLDKNNQLIAKLASQKSNNQSLSDKLGSFDFDKLTAALKAIDDDQEKELLKTGDVNEIVRLRLEKEQKQFRSQFDQINTDKQAAENQAKELQAKLNQTTVENYIRQQAETVKDLTPTAIDDIVSRSRTVFSVKDGNVVALENDLPVLVNNKPLDGVTFIEGLRETAPHYFGTPTGSGATGNGGVGGTDYEAAFKPESRNFTEQAKLQTENPELFAQLSEKYS